MTADRLDPALAYLPWWILLGLMAGWIAQSKGRSGISIFLVSLLLSPLVGAVIAFMMRWGDPYKGNEAYQPCTACGEYIKREAIVCKHCRTTVSDDAAEKQVH